LDLKECRFGCVPKIDHYELYGRKIVIAMRIFDFVVFVSIV